MHILVEKKSFPIADMLCEQWQGEGLPAPVILMGDTGSVLDDAWRLVAEDALPVWGSVLANSQKCGRGQTRRHWHSPAGNIYAALRLPAENVFLSTAAAPALSALLLLALQELSCPLRLKWPNDLVSVDGKYKVGGILLEEKQGIIIAGIGINVVHAPPQNILRENHALMGGVLPRIQGLFDSVSCVNDSEFTPESAAAQALWLRLVSSLNFCYKKKLLDNNTWKDVAEAFLLWKGQEVELDDGQERLYGILQGLGSQGEITLQIRGHLQQCTSGSLRLKK